MIHVGTGITSLPILGGGGITIRINGGEPLTIDTPVAGQTLKSATVALVVTPPDGYAIAEAGPVVTQAGAISAMTLSVQLDGTILVGGSVAGLGLMQSDQVVALDVQATLVRVGPEKVVNGTFDVDVSGWTAQANQSAEWAGSRIRITSSNTGVVYQSVSLRAGQSYICEALVHAVATNNFRAARLASGIGAFGQTIASTTTAGTSASSRVVLVAEVDSSFVILQCNGAITTEFDNLSVREVLSAPRIVPVRTLRAPGALDVVLTLDVGAAAGQVLDGDDNPITSGTLAPGQVINIDGGAVGPIPYTIGPDGEFSLPGDGKLRNDAAMGRGFTVTSANGNGYILAQAMPDSFDVASVDDAGFSVSLSIPRDDLDPDTEEARVVLYQDLAAGLVLVAVEDAGGVHRWTLPTRALGTEALGTPVVSGYALSDGVYSVTASSGNSTVAGASALTEGTDYCAVFTVTGDAVDFRSVSYAAGPHVVYFTAGAAETPTWTSANGETATLRGLSVKPVTGTGLQPIEVGSMSFLGTADTGLTRSPEEVITSQTIGLAATQRFLADGSAIVTTPTEAIISDVGLTHTQIDTIRGDLPAVTVTPPVAVSLDQASWGGVDLANHTTLAGAVSFEAVEGTTPTGLVLHGPSGLIHGVPTVAGTSSTLYRCFIPDTTSQEYVRVNWTITARGWDRVEGAAYLTVDGGGDDTATNTLMADSKTMTVACRMLTAASGSTVLLYEARGRSQIQFFSSGNLIITLRNAANAVVGSYSVTEVNQLMADGPTTLVVSVDTAQATAADRVRVWVGGVEQTVSGSTIVPQDTILDHTRSEHRAFATAGIPTGWGIEWIYFRSTAAMTGADFPVGIDFRTVNADSAEFIFGGSLAAWNAGTNSGVGADADILDSVGAPATVTLATAGDVVDTTPKAFPDAVGHGATATGGRGGTLRPVTGATPEERGANLAAAMALGGYVRLDSEGEYFLPEMATPVANTTIDARFTPGLGAWLRGSGIRVEGVSNVVIVGLLSAPGSSRLGEVWDNRRAISISATSTMSDVYVEDCAALWSTDECVTVWGNTDMDGSNLTLNRLVVAEALAFPREASPDYRAGHPLQIIFGGSADWINVSAINIASISGRERNPLVNPFSPGRFELEVIGSAFMNIGSQGGQYSTNNTGATTGARIETNIYFTGPMTAANIELIRMRGHATDPALDPTDLYLDPLTQVWSASGGVLTKTAFETDPTAPGDQHWIVRDANVDGTVYGSTRWGDPNATGIPARSDAPVYASADAMYRDLQTNVGPKLRNGGRHPFVHRVLTYGLPPLNEAGTELEYQPFLSANGYRGSNRRGLIDELTHLGVTVTPGTGTISVLVPADSLPAHPGHPWTNVLVEATPARGPEVEGWSALTSYSSTSAGHAYIAPNDHAALPADQSASTSSPGDDIAAPDWSVDGPKRAATIAVGGTAAISGLAAGTWVVRVGWRTASTTVWAESGLLWRVA